MAWVYWLTGVLKDKPVVYVGSSQRDDLRDRIGEHMNKTYPGSYTAKLKDLKFLFAIQVPAENCRSLERHFKHPNSGYRFGRQLRDCLAEEKKVSSLRSFANILKFCAERNIPIHSFYPSGLV